MRKLIIVIGILIGSSFLTAGCSYYPGSAKISFIKPSLIKKKSLMVKVVAPKVVASKDIQQFKKMICVALRNRGWVISSKSRLKLEVAVVTYKKSAASGKSLGILSALFIGSTLSLGETDIVAKVTLTRDANIFLRSVVSARTSDNGYNMTAYKGKMQAMEGVQSEFSKELANVLEKAVINSTTAKK